MRPSVLAAFHTFSEDLEGRLPLPYLCSAGKVTTAMGVMLPTASASAALRWRRPDGSLATKAEIIAEYSRVATMGCGQYDPIEVRPGVWEVRCAWKGSAKRCLAHLGWPEAAKVTTLRLSWEDVDLVTEAKLASIVRELRVLRPEWDQLCGDEQLFMDSWAWAVGPHSAYPRMLAALSAGDYDTAIAECTINPQRGTIITRNARNRVLLENARRVRDFKLDPAPVYWPRELAVVDREAETLREFPDTASSSKMPAAAPVLEEDGGAGRRSATTEAIVEAARDLITRRNGG